VISEEALAALIAAGPAVAVTVSNVRGSTPREAGAWMVVGRTSILGTIGGGQLEFEAIARARKILEDGTVSEAMDIALGPSIGQCCGGRVELELKTIDTGLEAELQRRIADERDTRPHVYLFGAGHVGRALVASLALLPMQVVVVETRLDELRDLPNSVITHLTPLPEAIVDGAPPHSAFVVLTHDHALDFLIVRAALQREDAAYVGMIGSATKRATFEAEFRRSGGTVDQSARLTCPIGAKLTDKRPEVIAALVAAELTMALLGQKAG
jgi:xanthine dehydrogenase accessory factor